MATGDTPDTPPPAPVFWRGRLSPQARLQVKRRSRRRWVAAFILLGIAFGAGFVGVMAWLRPTPRPALVPLWLDDYSWAAVAGLPQAGADRAAFTEGELFRPEAFG